MSRMASMLLISALWLSAIPMANAAVHPCTKEALPLTSEKSVVKAIECIYQGRVAKVERKDGYYRLRVVTPDGRIRNVDVDPKTGQPLK
ncbi:PepSY domain-containing protein [Reinekea thalattae]|uniref:PepSY domain-containing protein n=1 Tax=Reinekea thalattae TaxID=2593301 RepID=A0A5C8Z738_9GAMM|nr:PepSY domain-containing protein [Reinekea thalattae]TXR53104.1 PepSY domain-containing protein [Reinekea thalattae]